ncbi:hypothetical protein ACVWVY_001624 [Bradyrhizobium sp. URHC0002]
MIWKSIRARSIALFARGWEREVSMVGDVAKMTKQEINTVWIYPPKAERPLRSPWPIRNV